jgi:hypothetical protein
LIADSNSRLVLYLLRKKGGLLNSLLISASFTLAIMLNLPQKTMVMAT